MAEINLSSRQRYRKWHHWLEKLDIKQKHVPTPGAEELVMPPVENRGKRAYRNCVVELRGLESAITTMIERFKSDGSLIRVWDPGAGHRRRSP